MNTRQYDKSGAGIREPQQADHPQENLPRQEYPPGQEHPEQEPPEQEPPLEAQGSEETRAPWTPDPGE